MELYHIHVLGKHDNLFKNKEIIINKDTYNNELYERVYNSNYAVDTRKYPNTVEAINYYNYLSGFGSIGLYENISLILAGVIVVVFYLFLTLSDGALALAGLLFFVILFLI